MSARSKNSTKKSTSKKVTKKKAKTVSKKNPRAKMPSSKKRLPTAYRLKDPALDVLVGDCRERLPEFPEVRDGAVDLVFADPPFNWDRAYDRWDDKMPDEEYLDFTYAWLDLCIEALADHGSMWVNIPDDWAAEIVVHLKKRGLQMVNWCVWHYRFGQNTSGRFINSKVHALYFMKDKRHPDRRWNSDEILEASDRATTYGDSRTMTKKQGTRGMRTPMDVWYGKYWGRIQGNNKERRPNHDNQIPEVYLERVVRACSHEGDVVLDPFLGSGTTGLIARELRRRFIGTEFSPENAQSAMERIKSGAVRVRHDEPTRHASAIFAPRGTISVEGEVS